MEKLLVFTRTAIVSIKPKLIKLFTIEAVLLGLGYLMVYVMGGMYFAYKEMFSALLCIFLGMKLYENVSFILSNYNYKKYFVRVTGLVTVIVAFFEAVLCIIREIVDHGYASFGLAETMRCFVNGATFGDGFVLDFLETWVLFIGVISLGLLLEAIAVAIGRLKLSLTGFVLAIVSTCLPAALLFKKKLLLAPVFKLLARLADSYLFSIIPVIILAVAFVGLAGQLVNREVEAWDEK